MTHAYLAHDDCHAYEETTFSLSTVAPMPDEKRHFSRYLTILRVGALIADGRELCLIRNISAGGLMAHVYSRHAERRSGRGRAEEQPADARQGGLGRRFQCRHRVRRADRRRGDAAEPGRRSTMAGGRACRGSRSTGWRPCAAAPASTGSTPATSARAESRSRPTSRSRSAREVVLTLENSVRSPASSAGARTASPESPSTISSRSTS